MTDISGMVCVLKMWTVLLRGGLSVSKTTSGVSPLSALSSPFIPHYIKPSHAESPSGSLSPTGARKTSSSWKQLFVRYVSQSQQFSGWSRAAGVMHCLSCTLRPFLPTGTAALLGHHHHPLSQFCLRAASILNLNCQSL